MQLRREHLWIIVLIETFVIAGCISSCHHNDPDGAEKARILFEKKGDRRWLTVEGTVIKILDDDLEGSRHQRFIMETRLAQTLLVLHNIDLAKRVPVIKGTKLQVSGEYLWNSKGGRIHYTHLSNNKWKRHGYIKVLETGKIYQ